MSYEVEIKFRVEGRGHHDLAHRLSELGGESSPEVDQEDVYLSHPARDFGATGEALRLRREGMSNRLTYKGPRQGGPTKTREEIEVGFGEGAEAQDRLRRIGERLGFRTVAVLHKRRRAFRLGKPGQALAIEVVLDVAEDLGAFVEVEAIVDDAADLPDAQAAVLDLARALGLTEVEPRSYLRMAIDRRAGVEPDATPGSAGS